MCIRDRYLRQLTERYQPVRVPGLPPLIGGAIGYFAYDMVRLIERIPASGRDDLNLDDSVMMFYLGLVAFDHVQHRVWAVSYTHLDVYKRQRQWSDPLYTLCTTWYKPCSTCTLGQGAPEFARTDARVSDPKTAQSNILPMMDR